MIVKVCDRCRRETDRLFRTELVFTEMYTGLGEDGETAVTKPELCLTCTQLIEISLDRGHPDEIGPAVVDLMTKVVDGVRYWRPNVNGGDVVQALTELVQTIGLKVLDDVIDEEESGDAD